MAATHPEMGIYWDLIVKYAEAIYHKYLGEISTSRVCSKPTKKVSRSDIELRLENKIRTLLMSSVPTTIHRQCLFEQDLTSAQILYRTMVLAGPANREDRK